MTKASNQNSSIAEKARASLAAQNFNVGKGFDATKINTLDPAIIENIVTANDLSVLTAGQQVAFIKMLCESLGLNPLSKPLQLVEFEQDGNSNAQKKKTLRVYATRDCADQLRKIYNVSVDRLEKEYDKEDKTYSVTAYVSYNGRTDVATGIVSMQGSYTKQGESKKTYYDLTGQVKGNAKMKAETKAKRRATLSICGLGFLDETEAETLDGAKFVPVEQPEAGLSEVKEKPTADFVRAKIAACNSVAELEDLYESNALEMFDEETCNQLYGLLNQRHEALTASTTADTMAKVKELIEQAQTREELAKIMDEHIQFFKPDALLQKFKDMLNARREEIRRLAVKDDVNTAAKKGGLFQKRKQ